MLEEGHLLLLGTTGAGKTYQQRGFMERLRFNGRRVGAVDKLGNHWCFSRGELAAAVNMTATGGAFSSAVAELKRNELVEERGKRLFVAPALTGEKA